jgi:protein phosphatase 1 regulatory subunit 10
MMTVMPSNSFQPQTTQSQAQPATSQPQTQHLQSTSIQPAQPQPPDQKEAPLPPVVGLTPEQREDQKRQFQNSIRPLLQPTAFTGAQAVRELADRIADYGVTEVDAATRLEILARIRDGAGNHYYRAWSENSIAIDITREWIKAAAKGNNAQLVETTMPLLHVSVYKHKISQVRWKNNYGDFYFQQLIDRLPFNVESLSSSKLGRIIKKLVKDEPSPGEYQFPDPRFACLPRSKLCPHVMKTNFCLPLFHITHIGPYLRPPDKTAQKAVVVTLTKRFILLVFLSTHPFFLPESV